MENPVEVSELFENADTFIESNFMESLDFSINQKFGSGFCKVRPIKKGLSYCTYDFKYKKNLLINTAQWDVFDKIWVFVCLSGKASFTLEQRHFDIRPGCSGSFTGGYDISINEEMKKDAPYKVVSLILDHKFFTDLTGIKPEDFYKLNLKSQSANQLLAPKEMRLAAQQLAQAESKNVNHKLFLEAKALEILSYKLGLLETAANLNKEKHEKQKTFIEKIHYAAEILENNIINPPGIFDIADLAELNHNKLIKGFKEIYELTPFEYLSKVRLKKAAGLIRQGDLKVTEAAFSVGYSNLSHFARIFKKEFGENPSVYQKRFR